MDVAMRGQDHLCADIERFDVDWLINAFRSLVDENSRIKLACAAAVEARAAELSEQFDSLFLNDTNLGRNGQPCNHSANGPEEFDISRSAGRVLPTPENP
jgi:hypothetical protein